MKYVPKSKYVSKLCRIELLLMALGFWFITKNLNDHTAMYLVFCAVLLFVSHKFIFPRKWDNTIGSMVAEAPIKDRRHFSNHIEKHLPVLSRKKKTLIYKDDYGNIITERWDNELTYFIKKLDYYPLSTEYYMGLTTDQQRYLVNNAIDEYALDNEVKTSYKDSMNPYEYEHFCAEILNDNGWSARVTQASGDQGVDVIAEKNGVSVAIQCKKYSSPIGNGAVQEVVAGKAFYGASVAVVVTNNTYTASARTLANSQDVYLLHHDQLDDLDNIVGF
ncbi:restriction endonuclease [Pectobacterium carotovorum]